MKIGDATSLTILFFLLPGLIGLLIYQQIAESDTQRSSFDKVVVAAALALASAAITNWVFGFLGGGLVQRGSDTGLNDQALLAMAIDDVARWPLAVNIATSSILAALAAGIHNSGKLFDAFRFVKLTRKTGRIDIWHDAFTTYRGTWVRLTFKDGIGLLGWPQFYSSKPEQRELFIADATWIHLDGTTVDVSGPGVYVNDLTEVRSIEFYE